jgi:hypothetical protein
MNVTEATVDERGREVSWVRRHLNGSLTVTSVVIGIVGYLLGDRTNWTAGYGFDGRFYGELATNWASAVFGHGQIIPPGVGAYTGPRLIGVDSYYAFRIVPSGIVWLVSRALDLSPTHAHVVLVFAMLDAAMIGLVMFSWVRSADLLSLSEREKLLGATALIVSFAVLRTGTYYPVLTDDTGLGLGALAMLLWLRGSTVALVLCTIAGGFAWPTQLLLGLLLLAFPPPADVRAQLAAESAATPARLRWRPAPFGSALGAFAAISSVAVLTYLQVSGYRSASGTHQVPLFPLSVALVGVYVFGVIAFLVPAGGGRELLAVVRRATPWRVALAIAVIAGIWIGGSLIAHRPGYSSIALVKDSLWSTTLDPALFAVVFVAYYGPLVLVVLADLPRVARDAWRFGPAMVGILGVALLGALLDEPRKVVDTFPYLVLLGVLATRRIYVLTWQILLVFLGLAFFLARPWLPIGNISTDLSKLSQFPAQLYYMSSGIGTSPESYWLQLAAVALVALVLWRLAQPGHTPLAGRPGRDPRGVPARNL